jgi:site-specific recombinase XerD
MVHRLDDPHPMSKLTQPSTTEKLVPIVTDDELIRLLATCDGKSFRDRRDTAIIRRFLDTGARLAEIANLETDDLDLARDGVALRGKGNRMRFVSFGEQSGQALSRSRPSRR